MIPPIIGAEKPGGGHHRGPTVNRLRGVLFSSHIGKHTPNLGAFGPFSPWDVPLTENFIKINAYGKFYLDKFVDLEFHKFLAYCPPSDQEYYKNQLLSGPWRRYTIEHVKDAKRWWRHKSPLLGITGDINNRSHLSTPVYSYQTTINPMSIVTKTKLPYHVYSNLNTLQRLSQSLLYRSIYGSLRLDNTLPLVDKKFSNRVSTEPTNELQYTSHGHRMVADVNRYLLTKDVFEKPILGTGVVMPGMKTYHLSFTDKGDDEGTTSAACYTSDEWDGTWNGYCGEAGPNTVCNKGFVFAFLGGCFGPPGVVDYPPGEGDGQYNDDYLTYIFYKHYNGFSSKTNMERGFKGAVKRVIESSIERKEHSAKQDTLIKRVVSKPLKSIYRTDFAGAIYETEKRLRSKYKGKYLYTVQGMLGHGPRKTNPKTKNTHPYVTNTGQCCDVPVIIRPFRSQCAVWDFPTGDDGGPDVG